MPKPFHLTPTLRSRSLAERAERRTHRAAKTISKVDPAVVAPAAADPAVLVDLHSDLRLSLGALARDTGATFGPMAVTRLATGYVELAPADEVDAPLLPPLRVDARARLRLTKGLVHRLAVPLGAKVLVSYDPHSRSLRLINLGTLADLIDAALDRPDTSPAPEPGDAPQTAPPAPRAGDGGCPASGGGDRTRARTSTTEGGTR